MSWRVSVSPGVNSLIRLEVQQLPGDGGRVSFVSRPLSCAAGLLNEPARRDEVVVEPGQGFVDGSRLVVKLLGGLRTVHIRKCREGVERLPGWQPRPAPNASQQ